MKRKDYIRPVIATCLIDDVVVLADSIKVKPDTTDEQCSKQTDFLEEEEDW